MRQTRRSKVMRRWLGALAAGLLVGPVQAQGLSWEDGLRDSAPDRYTVVRGDTLWDISGRFLQHPWQWPEVWQVNPQIENPHLIYPGDTVYLYDCGGRPCLGLERGQGVVRLSPEVRTVPHREAIAPLPLESVRHFLREHRVVTDPEQLDELAYVVAGDDGRLVSGAGDQFYARGRVDGGGRFGIYRVGEHYRDQTSGELLGLELESVGEARRLRQEDEIAVMEATSSREEIRSNDIILPLEDRALTTGFLPRAPEQPIDGRILAVPGGVRFIGRLQVVALDRGTRDGLAAGHVLAVEQRGELVDDPRTGEALRMPGEDAGLVMVFRPYEKMSYGLVMRATRTLAVGDRLHNPRASLGTALR
ncbi:LysM peptidoglycan-binding domain-containing protein [Halomonas sp. M4R1S46]|uniref:LysM peptidoglycan-binding domain-containing protein n=1 Tax=Halomonas sp. M4R1S46 TaxID=2982692 RepID=UPI0021E47AC1|nr:LysM domain-containing protein [Halomonas sp. M4R1S46]UYG07327.1 LysM peptidoglycan-binding domain-containing protein [Halomonas sp. M4R1S46]